MGKSLENVFHHQNHCIFGRVGSFVPFFQSQIFFFVRQIITSWYFDEQSEVYFVVSKVGDGADERVSFHLEEERELVVEEQKNFVGEVLVDVKEEFFAFFDQ